MATPDHKAKPESVEQALFEVRRKIYPRAVSGWFAGWRWALVWATQILFYGLPWLTWGDRPAVLFALEDRRFFLFGLVLYPQDFIYLTGLLIVSALSLFLFTAVAGRLWCGYACPQTVYTEIFMWVERVIEGDRTARMKLDQAPFSTGKLARQGTKHLIWVLIALWTGISFVGYFTPIRELLPALLRVDTGPWETFWVLFYSFATWGNAGFMREQVCKYMCPYARFQSAMFDKDTLIITYDAARGEPRGSRSRKADPRAAGLGDCIDCGICVQVCPTGIDIRKGLQYECIGCAACIDGCNQVMDKMAYPRGLIRYSTTHAIEQGLDNRAMWRRVLRPRVLIYTAILLAIVITLGTSILLRTPFKADIIRDRILGRIVEDGLIENGYSLQLINSNETSRQFRVSVSGLESASMAGETVFEVGPAGVRMVPIRVRIEPGKAPAGSNKLSFEIEALDRPEDRVITRSTFYVPR
ncbi:MAG: cytochrome c oxidase accessory protein CcoG [Pseudomonadota bacterium]|jgi:cytochrome c oxidase accessory protein FixG